MAIRNSTKRQIFCLGIPVDQDAVISENQEGHRSMVTESGHKHTGGALPSTKLSPVSWIHHGLGTRLVRRYPKIPAVRVLPHSTFDPKTISACQASLEGPPRSPKLKTQILKILRRGTNLVLNGRLYNELNGVTPGTRASIDIKKSIVVSSTVGSTEHSNVSGTVKTKLLIPMPKGWTL